LVVCGPWCELQMLASGLLGSVVLSCGGGGGGGWKNWLCGGGGG
jgi:hypothetical protein